VSKPIIADLDWASDANFSAGPDVGQPTKVEPADPYKAQGLVPGEEFLGAYMNWLLHELVLWAGYVDGLPTDPDFVDEDFAWGGSHTFTEPVLMTNGSTTTTFAVGTLLTSSSIETGSIDADDIDATSTIHADGLVTSNTGFTTNTTHSFSIVNASSGNYNFTGTLPRLTATITACGGQGSAAWVPDGGDPWAVNIAASPDVADVWYKEVHLAHGANVVEFNAIMSQSADTATDMVVALVRVHPTTDVETPIADTTAVVFSGTKSTGPAWTGNHTVDASYSYFVKATGCDAAGTSCSFYKAFIEYDNPGPRNAGS
jgi:hypothetical protein